MKIKCEYCGSFINDYDEKCTSCGATNDNLKRNANNIPETIEQLKQWYIEHNLPDENITRFFIGKNYVEPKAFGIYKDETSQNFIVYKNKSDGKRAVRYEGKDEKYAVNELYQKLKEEIINQKSNSKNTERKKTTIKIETIIALMIIFIVIMVIIATVIANNRPSKGYYKYNDNYYYYQSGTWYINSAKEKKEQVNSFTDKWEEVEIENLPGELIEDSSKYYKSEYHKDEYRIGNVTFCSKITKISLDVNIKNESLIKDGYYQALNGDYYYCIKGFWFLFDTSDLGEYEYNTLYKFEKEKNQDWEKVEYLPIELSESYKEYFLSSTYRSNYSESSFEDSVYFKEDYDSDSDSSWDSDWDSDWDSSDSWDSSFTDWSSDW